MNPSPLLRALRPAVLILAAASAAARPADPPAPATAVPNPMQAAWSDPEFVRGFLGSYTYLQDREPELSEEEREAMRELIPVLKERPDIAKTQLEAQITPNVSAAFDFILANLYFQEGDLENAETYYRSAVEKTPAFRRAYKNLGLVLVQAQKFEEAIPVIAKAIDLGEASGRNYGLLGYSYLTLGRYYAADASYRQAILMQPEVKDWKIGLARSLLETEQYDVAVALFDGLLADDPENADFWLLQSNAFLGLGQPLRAAQNIEIVRRMGEADRVTLNLLGDIYMNNNSPGLALEAYLAAADASGDAEADIDALIRAAELFTRTTNFSEAGKLVATIRAKYGKVGEDPQLVAALEENLSNEQILTLLNLEARIARSEGDDETAVRILDQIVERDVLNGEAMIQLANYHAERALDFKDRGETALREAATEAEKEAAREILAAGDADWAKAVTRYENAAQVPDSERPALIAHAQALVRRGSYDDALPLLTLLAIARHGGAYTVFAPDIAQAHVIDHLSGGEMPETRNVRTEAARIARGAVEDLAGYDAAAFDALVMPGGFGAAKNLSSFAFDGPDCTVHPEVERAVRSTVEAGKPVGALCIAPAILARLLEGVEVTIGNDPGTAEAIGRMGGVHRIADHGEVIIDPNYKVLTTPCYMLDATIDQIADGADNIIAAMLAAM